MINRIIRATIEQLVDFKKAIIIKGARQVGKTTLIRQILNDKENILWIDGDDPQDRLRWNSISKSSLKAFISDYRFIVFDEAQRINNIGLTVKMILDLNLDKQVLVTGSSSLDLASSISEPLTGRKWSFELFPLSWSEIVHHQKLLPSLDELDHLLIFGNYPEIFSAQTQQERRLRELTNSYLYKDVLEVAQVRKPELIVKLLKALAYQIGSEVSYNELANMLQVDNETIKRYISLLEDNYVLFRLPPLSKNPRKEISTSRKIYFYDNGIRNALINNFAPLSDRNDIGTLWENFIISESLKKHRYEESGVQLYFWRNKNNSEVDLIVQKGQDLSAYEIKYNPRKKGRFSKAFIDNYQPIEQVTLNRDNFFEYLM